MNKVCISILLLTLFTYCIANNCTTDFNNQNACSNVTGCSWTTKNQCTENCSHQNTSVLCSATGGCQSNYLCKYNASACAAITQSAQCINGCVWNATSSACQNDSTVTCTDLTTAATCQATGVNSVCLWNFQNCSLSNSTACTITNPSNTTCLAANGCQFTSVAQCQGTYSPSTNAQILSIIAFLGSLIALIL